MRQFILLSLIGITLAGCSNQENDMDISSLQSSEKKLTKTTSAQSEVMGTPIYRFYGGGVGHYYTYYYNDGINAGYTPEGILGYNWLGASGGERVITRWYNRKNGDRLLTITPEELNGDIYATSNASGSILYHTMNTNGAWIQEGEMGRSWSSGSSSSLGTSTAIYRYYNASKKRHFFTNNIYEMGPGTNGYVYESIAFYLGN